MELTETMRDGVMVVEPRGRLDAVGSEPFGEHMVALIRSGARRLLIDFGQVPFVSSAGFRALLIAGKLAEETGGTLVLCGMSPEVRRIFTIGTFTDFFTICATAEEGIAKVK